MTDARHSPDSGDPALDRAVDAGHAPFSLRAGPIAVSAVLLIAIVVLALWQTRAFFRSLEREATADQVLPHSLRPAREVPPAPRLQADPPRELAEHRAELEALLGSYDWIDREAGIVRLPVERARELVLERGLPNFPPAAPDPAAPDPAAPDPAAPDPTVPDSAGAESTEPGGQR